MKKIPNYLTVRNNFLNLDINNSIFPLKLSAYKVNFFLVKNKQNNKIPSPQ